MVSSFDQVGISKASELDLLNIQQVWAHGWRQTPPTSASALKNTSLRMKKEKNMEGPNSEALLSISEEKRLNYRIWMLNYVVLCQRTLQSSVASWRHVNGYTQPSLNDLHHMVVSYGGGFMQYLDGKTTVTHIIASNLTPKKKVEFQQVQDREASMDCR